MTPLDDALAALAALKQRWPTLSVDECERAAKALRSQLHPDRYPDSLRPRATEAFQELQALAAASTPTATFTIATRKSSYACESTAIVRDNVCNTYRVVGLDNTLLKMPRSPKNNACTETEATALKRLDSPFFPALVESFRHRDARTRIERRCNVVKLASSGNFYNLASVLQAFPSGIEQRDAAWIFRRLLFALGEAHERGVVHSSLSLDNVLIEPNEHGLVVVDLTQATFDVDPTSDVHAAAELVDALCPRASAPHRAFTRGCRLKSLPDAKSLQQEYDELLARLYGRRRFHVFTMPDSVPATI